MPPKLPSFIDQVLFALPYGAVSYLESGAAAGAIVLVLTTLAVLTGHGNTMDVGEYDREPEEYEILTRWSLPFWPSLYYYDLFAHSVGGLLITLSAGIIVGSPALALSGLLKGPAYALAKKGRAGTAGGELLTGALLYSALV